MTPPRRQLGLAITAAIVVANMIGTGVFTSTGFQAASLGDPWTILLAWFVGGVLALCGASTYAELGSMMPKAGGEYVYLREAYHPVVGFMSGWVSLTVGFSGPIAASSILFANYLAALVPSLVAAPWLTHTFFAGDSKLFTIALGPQQAVSLALIVGITLLHSFDAKVGGWVQAAFTAVKVLLIVLFIVGGLLLGDGDWGNLASQNGGLANVGTLAFATTLIYVSFAYSGWNSAAYIAGEVNKPERNIPRALLLGTGTVMVLYVLLNLIFLYAVPISTLAPIVDGKPQGVYEVGDVAARQLFGSAAGKLVSSVIALALVSAVSAMVMAGPRVYAAMAEDKALPHWFARYGKRGVPVVSVVAQGAIASICVLIGDLKSLIEFIGFTLAIFAALAVGSVFILRRRGFHSAYRTFGYPVTPIAFICLSVWIAVAQIMKQPLQSAVVACVLIVGALLYFVSVVRAGRVARAARQPPAARVVSKSDDD